MGNANSLTTAIVVYCNYNGFVVWRNNIVGIYDPVKKVFRKNKSQKLGVSDIIGFRKSDGKFIAIEVKIGKDKKSVSQNMFKEEVEAGNALFFEAKDFDSFKKWFNDNLKM